MRDFSEIEALFSQLLLASTPVLSGSERAEVQHFLDVGEYGLSLETAVGIYSEEKNVAPTEVVDLIKRLAMAMNMDPALLLEKLPK